EWFRTIEDPGRGRTLRYPGPAWMLEATPAAIRRPAPLLGQHTAEVLREAGLDEDTAVRLAGASAGAAR
ncbi:MAG: CoA transferase, partial [Dehalococcoidia bacterium]